jgi:hypothetical protein
VTHARIANAVLPNKRESRLRSNEPFGQVFMAVMISPADSKALQRALVQNHALSP